MKITTIAIELLNTTENRMRLALALGVSEAKIRRDLLANEVDSDLTKKSSLLAISTLTGLKEKAILESSKELQSV